MNIPETERINLLSLFSENNKKRRFVQYRHTGTCKSMCKQCEDNCFRIFEKGTEIELPRHPNCDCHYVDVQVMLAGTVSKEGRDGPDYCLKYFGCLPSYYITKAEAEAKGWNNRRNTLAGKAPGKMIGGDVFNNDRHIFPIKEGRQW